MERITIEGRQEQAPTPQKDGWHPLVWFLITIVILVLVAGVAVTVARDLGLYTPPWMRAVLTPQSIPATTQPAATSAPIATRAPVVQQQAQPTTAPAIQADPAAPLPAVEQAAPVEYQAPAVAIPQPTADPWYEQTIKDQQRDACSMPRANPATCGQEVPPLPWPEGR